MVVLRRGEPGDRSYIPLGTRRGTIIRNETRAEMSPEQLTEDALRWQRLRPMARLRSATAVYDCMGLVFAARRTSVATDQLRLILEEDGYSRVTEENVDIGDLVVYSRGRMPDHIGLVSSIRSMPAGNVINVLSKWGASPEYEHPIYHVPEAYGRPTEFWTDRRLSVGIR